MTPKERCLEHFPEARCVKIPDGYVCYFGPTIEADALTQIKYRVTLPYSSAQRAWRDAWEWIDERRKREEALP